MRRYAYYGHEWTHGALLLPCRLIVRLLLVSLVMSVVTLGHPNVFGKVIEVTVRGRLLGQALGLGSEVVSDYILVAVLPAVRALV